MLALGIFLVFSPAGHAQPGLNDQVGDGLIRCAPSNGARTSSLPQARLHPAAVSGRLRRYGGAPISVTTFHYDAGRTGWDSSETDLTPASVASQSFGLIKDIVITGVATAQPLLVANYTMSDGSVHDVLIIATSANMVYAFDANSYDQLWAISLGPPVTRPITGCHHYPGISGTPVIGPGRASGELVIYLTDNTEPSAGVFELQVRALDLGSGQDVQPGVFLTASRTLPNGKVVTLDPSIQYNRAGLALVNGKIYVAISDYCESLGPQTAGWMFKISTDFSSVASFTTIATQTRNALLDSIWMSGYAPAFDAKGNLFVTTGNGDVTLGSPRDWGTAVIRLPPDLRSVADSFTPADFASLAYTDGDFSAGGVMLLPKLDGQTSHPLLVAMGKDPIIYLLDQTALGGYSSNNSGAKQVISLGGGSHSGVWGGPAYYDGPSGPTVFYQKSDDVLRSFHLTVGKHPMLTLVGEGASLSSNGGSIPVVSSNGSAPNSAVVWLVRRSC